jgi:hypothetical protein
VLVSSLVGSCVDHAIPSSDTIVNKSPISLGKWENFKTFLMQLVLEAVAARYRRYNPHNPHQASGGWKPTQEKSLTDLAAGSEGKRVATPFSWRGEPWSGSRSDRACGGAGGPPARSASE